jgi:Tat (twin-arginine translocation) pathway signal sequence
MGMKRRELLRRLGLGVAAVGLGQVALGQKAGRQQQPVVVVAEKDKPAELVRKAIKALGGMGRFVKKGNRVLIKPNIAFARPPEGAANTNPEVVAELVQLCFEAGAKEVIVLDYTLDPARITYEMSGIAKAAEAKGARAVYVSPRDFVPIEVPKGKILSAYDVRVLKQVLDADVFINVPIAKTHGSARLTLGMKNLMGIIQDRGAWHRSGDLHQCIADFVTAVKPHLAVIDAIRILASGGPKGPGRVEQKDTIIASTDIVAADAYATTLFGLTPNDVPHIIKAAELGVGVADLKRVKIVKV